MLTKLIVEKKMGSPNLACFHAQQAAEKYLKGFLAYYEKHTRKINDLQVLLENCKKIEPSFGELENDARYLTRFYTESRYPDDYVEFSHEEAGKALGFAIRIKKSVVTKIKPQEKRGGFGAIGLIALIGSLITLLGGGYFVYQYQKTKNVILPTKEEKTSPAAPMVNPLQSTSSAIDTSQWKTYRNEEYGFEVKYPPGQSLNIKGQDEISTPGGGERLLVEVKSTDIRFTVSVVSAVEASAYIYPADNAKKIIIADKEGLMAVRKINGESMVSFVIFSVINGEFRYDLRFHDVTKLSDTDQQILSTFKFIK